MVSNNGRKPKESTFDFRNIKPPRKPKEEPGSDARDEDGFLIWPPFWNEPFVPEDWLLEPLLPRSRSIAMYCVAGVGKSELTLFICARLATGQAVLDRPAGEPLNVVYLDYEMTMHDVRERLTKLGYGPESDLSHLHYCLLPTLPPLDTVKGGDAVLQIALDRKADLVVIDTTSRVISGAESDSDSFRDFHQHSGRRLKEAGITIWRLDHAGKSIAAGQRGSSAKNDDVDVIWQLSRTKAGSRLFGEKRRQSWVPENIYLTRKGKPLRYEPAESRVTALVAEIEKLDLPRNLTVRDARIALKKANIPARQEQLADAVKMYQSESEVVTLEFW